MYSLGIIMRIVVYGVLIAVISNACTTLNTINYTLSKLHYIDSAIWPYVTKFVVEGGKRGYVADLSNITVIFGTTNTKEDAGTVGTCSAINGFPLVVIDQGYWNISNVYEKEELIMHELGHCLLNREHCEAKENGEGVSLMKPDLFDSSVYSNNREKLIDELFKVHDSCKSKL